MIIEVTLKVVGYNTVPIFKLWSRQTNDPCNQEVLTALNPLISWSVMIQEKTSGQDYQPSFNKDRIWAPVSSMIKFTSQEEESKK